MKNASLPFVAWVGAMLAFAPLAGADPVLTFSPSSVTVSGASASGKVVLFSVGLRRDGAMGRRVELATVLTDSDGDGVVTYPLAEAAPAASVWVAVDLASGGHQLTSPVPRGFQGRKLPIEPQGESSNFLAESIVLAREQAIVLLVRPADGAAAGAWQQRAFDGGGGDYDGVANGAVRILLGDMVPLLDLPAPFVKEDGDVIVRVDPTRLDYSVQVVVLP